MRGREKNRSLVSVTIIWLVILLVPSLAKAVATGQITRAETDAHWVLADLSGAVNQQDFCEEGPEEPEPPEEVESSSATVYEGPLQPVDSPWECGWTAYATLGPGSSIADCSTTERRWSSIGSGVQLVWLGEEVRGQGVTSFDRQDLALEFGANAPLLCLSVVEAVREQIQCPEGEETCPPYAVVHRFRQLDAVLLTPASESSSSGAPVTSSSSEGPPPSARPCRRVKHKLRRHRDSAKTAISSRVRISAKKSRSRACKGRGEVR